MEESNIDEIKMEKQKTEKYYFSGIELVQSDPSFFIAIKGIKSIKAIQKFHFNISASSHIEFRIYENSEIIEGNKLNIYNYDRNYENSNIVEAFYRPGIINSGSLIFTLSRGKDGYENPTEFSNDWNKFTLKNDTYYLIEISSKCKNNIVNYWFSWEEKVI